MNRVMQDRQT